jgi:hypothetical protein
MKKKTFYIIILAIIILFTSCNNKKIKYEIDEYFNKDEWVVLKFNYGEKLYEIDKYIYVENKITNLFDYVNFKIEPINYETYLKLPDPKKLKYILEGNLYNVNYYSSAFNLKTIEILYFSSENKFSSKWVIHFELKSENNNKFDYYFNYDLSYFILIDKQVFFNNELISN